MKKPKKSVKGAKQPHPDELIIRQEKGEEDWQSVARVYRSPITQAALTQKQIASKEGLHLEGLINNLNQQVEAASNNNSERLEAMLIAQAHTLDAIFNNMTQRAIINAGDYIGACDTYLKLGLRAQSQCRATLEALNEIKNPKSVAFVKQANIAGGHQQVNNGTSMNSETRVEENPNQPNELLEAQHGERMDIGTTATAGRDHSRVEAVGAKHRAKDWAGEGQSLIKCV